MEEQMKLENAKRVYKTLCDALDARSWKYSKNEEDLRVEFGVSGDDLLMRFIMVVDADRQLVRLVSFLPFNIPEDKRMEGAVATCVASYGLLSGSFDYDISDGSISFRMTAAFHESEIGEMLLQVMISTACQTVDRYNDRFLAVGKGLMSLEDFIKADVG